MDIKEKEALLCSKYNNINRLLAIMNVEKQDREDLLQDIFIKALRSLKQLKDVEKMDARLWSITRNEVNRHWRQVMKNRESLRFLDAEEIEINVARRDGSYYLRLADELEQIGDREQLARLLRKLPEDAIILLRLYYYEGYNLSEIAQITGESENTVKSRHRRALEKLRDFAAKETVIENRQQGKR